MNETQLTSMLTPILEQCGLELETLETMPAGRRRLVRVVVDGDGPEGRGPTLDEIADATRVISVELDESEAVGNAAYTLEVTSRGLSRPLTEPKHWRRNIGRLVKVHLGEGEEPVQGRISGSDDTSAELEVVLDARKGLHESRTVGYAEVTKAVLVPELTKEDHDTRSAKGQGGKVSDGKGQGGKGKGRPDLGDTVQGKTKNSGQAGAAAADTTEEN